MIVLQMIANTALFSTTLSQLLACTVCYGDPNSAMAKGLTMGVVVLVGVIGFLLIAFAWFFVTLWRRAAYYQGKVAQESSEEMS